MSIIAQTRLGLSSVRFLSTTLRRYDVRDILSLPSQQNCQSHGDFQDEFQARHSSHREDQRICTIQECNTSEFHRRILVQDVKIGGKNGEHRRHIGDVFKDSMYQYIRAYNSGHKDLSSRIFRKISHLFKRDWCIFGKVCLYNINRVGALDCSKQTSWCRDDHYTQGNQFMGKKISLPYMLGILGIFKIKTSSDNEDQEQLTDEEKMKKMKPIELLIAKGVLSMMDQEFSKANELFHNALHIAQDDNDEKQELLIFNLLACNFFESGDLENAEKLFIDLIKRYIHQNVEPTDPAILELSLKLASIYGKNYQTHQKALQGFKFVINSLLSNLQDVISDVEVIEIDKLTKEKRDELALLGWSYDWFAKHLILINDYKGATELLQEALRISSKVLGPLHDQTLILLNDIGTTMAMNGVPEEGIAFLEKAVAGGIESQSNELASFYANLGLVNFKLNRLNEAKRYCEYSIELASKNREHHSSQEIIQLSKNCLNQVDQRLSVKSNQ